MLNMLYDIILLNSIVIMSYDLWQSIFVVMLDPNPSSKNKMIREMKIKRKIFRRKLGLNFVSNIYVILILFSFYLFPLIWFLFLFYFLDDKDTCDHNHIEHHMTLYHRLNIWYKELEEIMFKYMSIIYLSHNIYMVYS